MDQLIVALDVESAEHALRLAGLLRGVAGGFKVGSRLFTSAGPDLVRRLADAGDRVFLDLKFHDIPHTVAQAVDAGVGTGAWMINVHASGGLDMMQAAVGAGRDAAARLQKRPPLLVGVTILTSMDATTLDRVGFRRPLLDQTISLALLAQEAGLDGVVASPRETPEIRRACGEAFTIVTPGIRGASAGDRMDDQVRTMAPGEAVRAGANYIVVGRPIIAAADPLASAQAIAQELRQ